MQILYLVPIHYCMLYEARWCHPRVSPQVTLILYPASKTTYICFHSRCTFTTLNYILAVWYIVRQKKSKGKQKTYFSRLPHVRKESHQQNINEVLFVHKDILYSLVRQKVTGGSWAEFLDEIQTKVFRVFLLAIHSHLYSFALLCFFKLMQNLTYFFKLTQPLTYFYK